ncbi:MAG: hypothetical protein ACKVOL_11450 [Novosphingobium sp.]
MVRILVRVAAGLAILLLAFAIWFYANYGGTGQPFPKMGDARPRLTTELLAAFPEPPGNLAVSVSGCVFFTYHAEGHPQNALARWPELQSEHHNLERFRNRWNHLMTRKTR